VQGRATTGTRPCRPRPPGRGRCRAARGLMRRWLLVLGSGDGEGGGSERRSIQEFSCHQPAYLSYKPAHHTATTTPQHHICTIN